MKGGTTIIFFFLQEASKAEKNQSREISWQPKVYARGVYKLLFYPHWTKGDVIWLYDYHYFLG